MTVPFKKILVANRGEIAVRIFRAATELGLSTVGVYSHEDRLSVHRYKADEAWQLGEVGQPMGAYLDIEAIIDLAKRRGVDAIHPGYGFLSENGTFARRCEEEGIAFVGPPADVIDVLGDKVAARELARDAWVPIIPGSDGPVADVDKALEVAESIGYPVMLKAAFGGGGRGMRRCADARDLREGYENAHREATAAFGRGDIFLEKFIDKPRHIEVQLLADKAGNFMHLFERDCSIQRRHQKVVEVAPAIGLSKHLRTELYEAALRVGQKAGLVNAATVEFLVDDANERFYFIEVNPRLQVEHTITELITGVDIVQTQFKIAEGKPLDSEEIGLSQDALTSRGAAIQARITTENPQNNFSPDTGRVHTYRSAAGFGIRLDVGVAGAGAVITPYYDSLLVKVSSFALTHTEASRKLHRSLQEFRIRGVSTNIDFLLNILEHPTFSGGKADTGFVERSRELFEFRQRRNRASRLLSGIANTVVNGPPGVEQHLERPTVRIAPPAVRRLERTPTESPKAILDVNGAEALARWCDDQESLLITDTTFRDAHQSLLATRVRTRDMLDVAAATEDRLRGAFSVECWGGATFDVAYRFLREDPWSRLAALRKAMPNTLLQMLLRGSNAVGYANYPENVIRRFVQLAAETGIDVFRIFDCFNQLDAMRISIDEVRQSGKVAEVCICFSGDFQDPSRPQYSLDYYRQKAVECAEAGAHILAIKDMAGLLKPRAAPELVEALKSEVDLPIHLHTHDTSGNGVAMLLAAADAGVDIVDVASASMSGLTSQPSMDAVVAALRGSPRAPRLDMEELQELSDYWEAVRTRYKPFESGLMSSTTDVYRHEIPGGQYSNLKPQALAVGLAEQWGEIRERYREVSLAFGDVIKVTPSSKVVGDFALWLVRNGLTVEQFLASDQPYDLPQSVIGFFEGQIGIPHMGFPDALRRRVLGPDASPPPTEGATASMEPYDWDSAKEDLLRISSTTVTPQLEASFALYPKVVRDYLEYRAECGDVAVLDTETFLYGMEPEQEAVVEIEEGKSLIIKHKAVGALRDDGTREVHFMLNGQARSVFIKDRSAQSDAPERTKADPTDRGQVGAPMPGNVLSVDVKVGDHVEEGDKLGVLEAMKLETTLRAPQTGEVVAVEVKTGDRVGAGELLFTVALREAA